MKTSLTFKQFSSALLDGHILEHTVLKTCIHLNPEGHIAYIESGNLAKPSDLNFANWRSTPNLLCHQAMRLGSAPLQSQKKNLNITTECN